MANYENSENGKRLFVIDMYNCLFNEGLKRGLDQDAAKLFARRHTYQTAVESGYGTSSRAKRFNYGGLETNINYGSNENYAKAVFNMFESKWPLALRSKDLDTYLNDIRTKYHYFEADPKEYRRNIYGTKKRIDGYIDEYLNSMNTEPIDVPEEISQEITFPNFNLNNTFPYIALNSSIPNLNNTFSYIALNDSISNLTKRNKLIKKNKW